MSTLLGWDNETGEGLFTGDFGDLTKGKEATESLFDEGADIFIPVGGLIGTPGFDVARERGGYGIWVDVDGYNLLPEARDVMLTSVMKNMDNSVYDVIEKPWMEPSTAAVFTLANWPMVVSELLHTTTSRAQFPTI